MAGNIVENKKKIRVWCDGCYDLTHFGHANSLRQAKAMCDDLVVGIHSDEEIKKNKGPPVFTQDERFKMINAIKWVDKVVKDAPYVTTVETLDRNDCDFCVHGNDITMTLEGIDTYRIVKNSKRYKECRRTEGVSTTNLLKRVMMCNKQEPTTDIGRSPYTGVSPFLLTTEKLKLFSSGMTPKVADNIIYVAGAFDLFHVGHVDFLEAVRKECDFLFVGIYADSDIQKYNNGGKKSIMNLVERTLSVLACKFVSEVVIQCPYFVTNDLMTQLKIDLVCQDKKDYSNGNIINDPFKVPKILNKFKIIDSGNSMTTEKVFERILKRREAFEARNAKKEKKESAAYEEACKLIMA